MATYTTNLGLKKPDYEDLADIADVNANMDILDAAVASKLEASDVVNNLTETVTGKALDATQGKELAEQISAHTENTLNPHAVTKSQVGLGSVSNVAQMPITGGTFTGIAVAQNNTNYTTKQLRNVILSTANPSGGSNGDIWFKYTP